MKYYIQGPPNCEQTFGANSANSEQQFFSKITNSANSSKRANSANSSHWANSANSSFFWNRRTRRTGANTVRWSLITYMYMDRYMPCLNFTKSSSIMLFYCERTLNIFSALSFKIYESYNVIHIMTHIYSSFCIRNITEIRKIFKKIKVYNQFFFIGLTH